MMTVITLLAGLIIGYMWGKAYRIPNDLKSLKGKPTIFQTLQGTYVAYYDRLPIHIGDDNSPYELTHGLGKEHKTQEEAEEYLLRWLNLKGHLLTPMPFKNNKLLQ